MKKFICKKLTQLLCNHDYVDMRKPLKSGELSPISGATWIVVCKHCGKVKGEYFKYYEGNGYR